MIPEKPMDIPKGFLADELALYRSFGISATETSSYTEIHAAIGRLSEKEYERFIAAWRQLCDASGRGEVARSLWNRG